MTADRGSGKGSSEQRGDCCPGLVRVSLSGREQASPQDLGSRLSDEAKFAVLYKSSLFVL